MKIKWLARTLCLIAVTTVLQGCATYVARNIVPGEREFHGTPVLTDEILAIGRPDEKLLKQLDLSNTIAFIGKENTYMLYLGGEELEQISNLKLEGKRMSVDSRQGLYLKDKQVWGEIKLYYNTGKEVTAVEKAELELGGFKPAQRSEYGRGNYVTTVRIEGVVYPAIKIPDEQISKLSVRRYFALYPPREASPPFLGKVVKVPIIAVGVAIDFAISPVFGGLGGFFLVKAAGNGGQ